MKINAIIAIILICLISCQTLQDPIDIVIINETEETIYVDVKEEFSSGDKIKPNSGSSYTIEKNSIITATGTKTSFSKCHNFTIDGEIWRVDY
jgi:hypothetical protein